VLMSSGQQYYFRAFQTSFDNGMYLYRSSTGNYYQPRQDFVTFSNQPDADLMEAFLYTAPATDWYGLLMPVFSESSGSSAIWWGPREVLAEDVIETKFDDVMWGTATVASSYWTVFAVRGSPGDDPNINLYDNSTYTNPRLVEDQVGGSHLHYVVGDFNHNANGVVYPLVWEDGGNSMTTEWEGGSESLAYGTNAHYYYDRSWPAGDVAVMFDIYLPQNSRIGVLVEDLSGNMDLGMELFDSNAATYYAARGGGVAAANASGVGGNEYLSWVNLGSADWVGLVIYNRNTSGGNYRVHTFDISSVDVAADIPKSLQFAAAPNPWTSQATLRLAMPVEGDAMIDIIDLQGRLVREVHRGKLPAGVHELRWDGRDMAGNTMAPGVYMARLRTDSEQRMLKLVRAN